jgi:hypothetical protein
MSFTVDDFEDLLRLLYERPEWQERLRRAILPPELFELPRLAQELADANRAERERVAGLEAEQQATRQEMREGFAQTGKRLDRVEAELAAFRTETGERFEQVDQRFDRVEGRLQQLSTDLGTLKGADTEEWIQKHVPRFRHLIPRPTALTPAEVADLLL